MLRVLVIDDDVTIRQHVVRALERGGVSVVANVGSVAEAEDIIRRGVDCEVALVDLGLPDGSGTQIIRMLRRDRPNCAALAFTIFDDATNIMDALKAGAKGYLLKDTPKERLIAVLQEAADGGSPMTPSVARKVVESFNPAPQEDGLEKLTPRERDVLEYLTRGQTYAQVAQVLGVELSTVQGFVKSIYRKLEVRSKAEATAVAIKRQLVVPQP